MHFVVFTHSLISDWNHGNAHFLRGICTEIQELGHTLDVYEPEDSWSRRNLLEQAGPEAVEAFHRHYPTLHSTTYTFAGFDLDTALRGADVVLVHEWNDPALIARIGEHRSRNDYTLLFHDTHHRGISERNVIARFDLSHYDGVLAYGEVLRKLYLANGWAKQAWTWHEAADTRVFRPIELETEGDVVWIGNWGDDERAETLREYLIHPVKQLHLRAAVYGVRYPADVLDELADAGIEYRGWLPNFRAPEVFAGFRLTVHVPRRPYVEALPGIPTIRPFEALACGIPLISAPWSDCEGLFRTGMDLRYADSGEEMRRQMDDLLSDPAAGQLQSANGLETIWQRHTCAHRVQQLLEILQ